MEKIVGLDFCVKNSAVSLGKFDGIHRGHQCLLERIKKQNKYIPTVFTFVMAEKQPKIYTQQEKDSILEQFGIQREVLYPFEESTKNMLPEAFVSKILMEKMDTKYICVGEDFRFGKDRAGDVTLLEALKNKYGYTLEIVEKLRLDGDVVSSTRIRKLLSTGELKKANVLLGIPFFVQGQVIHGEALGRTLDLPTANLIPVPEKILLPDGVYATTVRVDGKEYAGVTNIGKKPTVGEHIRGIETHILDFKEDIYGQEICVSFIDYIRPEMKFSSVEELRTRIEQDKNVRKKLQK